MIEFDGPPLAYFELPNGKKYTYTVYALGSIGEAPDGRLALQTAKHLSDLSNEGVIVWRRKPQWDFDPGGPDPTKPERVNPPMWKISYRLTVIPWNDIDACQAIIPNKEEGMPAWLIAPW